MSFQPLRVLTTAFLLLGCHPLQAAAPTPTSAPPPATSPAAATDYADLTLGGYSVLRLRGAAGGLGASDRIGVILSRLTPLLGVPNIRPSDVVVYLPPPTSRVNRAPVIYALGRRLVTVDPATVKAAGGGTALTLAVKWAKRLQQVLPRVNWRPPNAPNPKVPANPPLVITPDFAQVGGMTALVTWNGKGVLKLRGPQAGGLTAQERADLLSLRLNRLASRPDAGSPDAVRVTAGPGGTAALSLSGTTLVVVTAADARAAGSAPPSALANAWAKNLRLALAPRSAPPAPAPAVSDAPVPAPTPSDPLPAAPPPASGG